MLFFLFCLCRSFCPLFRLCRVLILGFMVWWTIYTSTGVFSVHITLKRTVERTVLALFSMVCKPFCVFNLNTSQHIRMKISPNSSVFLCLLLKKNAINKIKMRITLEGIHYLCVHAFVYGKDVCLCSAQWQCARFSFTAYLIKYSTRDKKKLIYF